MFNLISNIKVQNKPRFNHIYREFRIKDTVNELEVNDIIFSLNKLYQIIKTNFEQASCGSINISMDLTYDFGNFSSSFSSTISKVNQFEHELYHFLIALTYTEDTAKYIVDEVVNG